MAVKSNYESFIGADAEKRAEKIAANRKKAETFLAITDGSGRGIAEGTEFRWPAIDIIESDLAYNFDVYNGNDFAQVLVEDAKSSTTIIGITSSRLSAFLREVDDKGQRTGNNLQPAGWLAETWRKPGGRETVKARIKFVRDELDKYNAEHADNPIDHFIVKDVHDVKVPLYQSDRDNPNYDKPYSSAQLANFFAVLRDGTLI